MSLTSENIAGFWGWRMSNSLEYAQSGVAPAAIITDDGIPRQAFPISLQTGQTLYHRPQEEWETPTEVGVGYAFSPDGKFEKLISLESGEMPKGYLKQVLHQVGTYRIEGDIVIINYTYNVATFYSDLQNSLTNQVLPPETAYLRVSLGDGTTPPTITELVKQPDGSLVPNPGNPQPMDMERNPNYQPIDLTRGLKQDGTLRDDTLLGTSLADSLNGGSGNDSLIGDSGSDQLVGAEGNDLIKGGDGDDRLSGGGGSDRIWSGAGSDVISGGGARDFFALEKGLGVDRITDFQNGTDKLGLTPGVRFGQLDVNQRGNRTVISINNDPLAILTGVRANQITAADFTRMAAS